MGEPARRSCCVESDGLTSTDPRYSLRINLNGASDPTMLTINEAHAALELRGFGVLRAHILDWKLAVQ